LLVVAQAASASEAIGGAVNLAAVDWTVDRLRKGKRAGSQRSPAGRHGGVTLSVLYRR